jgi:predicted nuclease of predicted toxin-antitoxin system
VKILIDMNLTPLWVEFLATHGVEAQHWSDLGSPRADDRTITDYARDHGFVIFTHDLDFGSILAVTHARGPSVIQARTADPVPAAIGPMVIAAIRDHASDLDRGALITLEPDRMRARILPIVPGIGGTSS